MTKITQSSHPVPHMIHLQLSLVPYENKFLSLALLTPPHSSCSQICVRRHSRKTQANRPKLVVFAQYLHMFKDYVLYNLNLNTHVSFKVGIGWEEEVGRGSLFCLQVVYLTLHHRLLFFQIIYETACLYSTNSLIQLFKYQINNSK